jgi:diguanylate cyclase (GGDEF)-like protein
MKTLSIKSSIRFRSIVVLILIQLLLFVLVFFTVQSIAVESVRNLEYINAKQNAVLVERILVASSSSMTNTVRDWAIWNETYDYIEGNNPTYEDNNLYYESFETLNVNLVLYYDATQQIVFSAYYDFVEEIEIPVDPEYLQIIEDLGIPENTSKEFHIQGMIATDLGLFYIVSSPILKNNEITDVAGNVVFARLIDRFELDELEEVSGFPFEIVENTLLNHDTETIVEDAGNNQILVKHLIHDLFHNGLYMFQFLLDKKIEPIIGNTLLQLAISISLVGVIFALSTMFYLDKEIFRRLLKLNKGIQKISENGDFSTRLSISPKIDEIDYIGLEINSMLDKLKESEQKINQMSYTDYLTKIPNRLWFYDHMETTIQKANQSKEKFAVLFLDLDGFKLINDTYGHGVGDEFLIKVSDVFLKKLDKNDAIARIGGDEFLIMKKYKDITEVNELADRLLTSLKEGIMIHEIKLEATVSIGIALYPEHASTKEDLVLKADKALYGSKSSGKNSYQYVIHIK